MMQDYVVIDRAVNGGVQMVGYGYFRMLFKENLIGKTIWFCKEMNECC